MEQKVAVWCFVTREYSFLGRPVLKELVLLSFKKFHTNDTSLSKFAELLVFKVAEINHIDPFEFD